MQDKKSRFLKSEDGTIYDSKTSITWVAEDSRLMVDKEVTWDEANQLVQELNEKKFGGHEDWRIPTIQEAVSLYEEDKLNKDFKNGDIHIDPLFPAGSGNCTWTSETRGGEAQIVFYVNGFAYWYEKNDKTISHAVRMARRG